MVGLAAGQQLFHFDTSSVFVSIGAPVPLSPTPEGIIHAHCKPLCSFKPFHAAPEPGISDARLSITTYNPLLRDAGDNKNLSRGRLVHAHILLMGFLPDRFLGNLLIQMYGKCGSLEDAQAVFASMHARNVFSWTLLMGALIQCGMLDMARSVFDLMPEHDVTSWNSMIAAYSQNGRDGDALKLFDIMQMEGYAPDCLTFVSILTACAHMRDFKKCMEMHASVLSWGFEKNRDLMNPLINMYNKCGSLHDTEIIFNKLEDRTIFAWNAVLAICVREGYANKAFQIYEQMPEQGMHPDEVSFITLLGSYDLHNDLPDGRQLHACIIEAALEPDVMTGNALISMYGRCEAMDDAHRIFNRMVDRNVITWNAWITVLAQMGNSQECLIVFLEMESRNIEPNNITYISLLDVCATMATLAEGKKIHEHLSKSAHRSDLVVMTALLNMYGRCGSLKDAHEIFDLMTERDIIAWNALISAYIHNKFFDKASELFQKMVEEFVQPNKVTYANVLMAYANLFALVDGQDVHAHIVCHGVQLDILVGNSLITFYGKCGRVEDAWIMFHNLPTQDIISWNAIVNAFSQHGYARKAFSLLQMMPAYGNFPNGVTFLSILTAFAHNGLLKEGCFCFISMFREYLIPPYAEHYNVMIDLFGRAGGLDEAEAIIERMPMEPDTTSWMGFIAACQKQLDFVRGVKSAAKVINMDPDHNPAYVLLSNISIFDDA